jgi:hypothetical protein
VVDITKPWKLPKDQSLRLPAEIEPQQFGRRSLHARRGHNDFGAEKGPTIGRSKSERARLSKRSERNLRDDEPSKLESDLEILMEMGFGKE